MQFICDAPPLSGRRRTWFRIESEAEADAETALMRHAVAQFFARDRLRAVRSYVSPHTNPLERDIGLRDHVARTMSIFLTLRDEDGAGLATAMLPPMGREDPRARIIIVGPDNTDPYADHADAIATLGAHYGLILSRHACYPYRR